MSLNYRGTLVLVLLSAVTLASASLVHADNYKVGAYYFGVWSAANCNYCWGDISDPWLAAEQYWDASYDCPGAPWDGTAFPSLKPSLGFYNNSDPAVIAAHIHQARANGIDFTLDGQVGAAGSPDVLGVNDLCAVDAHTCHAAYSLSLDGDPHIGSHAVYNAALLANLETYNTKQ